MVVGESDEPASSAFGALFELSSGCFFLRTVNFLRFLSQLEKTLYKFI